MPVAAEVKERPIIFSGEMVRAILEGRKVQTRRVIKPQPVQTGGQWFWKNCSWTAERPHCPTGTLECAVDYCPYGQPGDRLWVRETWLPVVETDDGIPGWFEWNPEESAEECPDEILYRATDDHHPQRWRNAMFMPRWASRLTLEITEVRVQRVQEISEADSVKEGIFNQSVVFAKPKHLPRDHFRELWDSINARRGFGWDSNCWVWAISFRPIPNKE